MEPDLFCAAYQMGLERSGRNLEIPVSGLCEQVEARVPKPTVSGIPVRSFMPVLSDLELRQRYWGFEPFQTELLCQVNCDMLRYGCDAVGSRRNNSSGYETRHSKQNALWGDFGFQRVLNHTM